ncbi:dienelactone hydrolase family protein [Microvirga sp. W0021]|uniref:Dienelactone hydrolase family protein n=1 Tax=Hohaiivirga grylli TaxID=3133970 RepID=A0ABV0BL51_9HYPH
MSTTLDGPRIAPASGTATQLVVFLHGYGADGNDLIDLGAQWQRWMPDTAFVSPNAPEPCGMSPMGRQWFDLTFQNPNERWVGVNHAAPVLNAFLDSELARYNLKPAQLALVGFSQGTMMALHVGLRRPEQIGAILGYSGIIVFDEARGPESLADDITSKPPVMLIHGDQDQVIPPQALPISKQILDDLGVPTQAHISRGLAHGIDGEGFQRGGAFLLNSFGIPLPK